MYQEHEVFVEDKIDYIDESGNADNLKDGFPHSEIIDGDFAIKEARHYIGDNQSVKTELMDGEIVYHGEHGGCWEGERHYCSWQEEGDQHLREEFVFGPNGVAYYGIGGKTTNLQREIVGHIPTVPVKGD